MTSSGAKPLKNRGQESKAWTQEWQNLSPNSEIQMWDYFGGRPWILKYSPRFGKVLEAGCGLGRYVFYLSHLGVDIAGLDFSRDTIDFLLRWQKKYNYEIPFEVGDVKRLNYDDNSLSGYLSFGVVEHFIEGPHIPLKEAFRVLRPGGVAIITTPSPSWSKMYFKKTHRIKVLIKNILKYKTEKSTFFQYEYNSKKLSEFVRKEGFHISKYSGADWLFTFCEFGRFTDKYIKSNSFGYRISHFLENSWLSFFGAQSIVIAVKIDEFMHCFLCGEKNANAISLDHYDVPICESCMHEPNANFYIKGRRVSFHKKYNISPPIQISGQKECEICNQLYQADLLFENFGLINNVCKECLKDKKNSIQLSNTSLQPIWRKRQN